MYTKKYPLNPRDENQPVLPHGNKALFLTLGVFFVLAASTVVLLNYATAPDVQYSNLESDAANEDVEHTNPFLSENAGEMQRIDEKLKALERRLSSTTPVVLPPPPAVDFGN